MHCGVGPLHGPLNTCPAKPKCSFLRMRIRLCYDCAVGVDIYTRRWSPIEPHALYEPRVVVEMYELGRTIVEATSR
jgi:hypothetical protein